MSARRPSRVTVAALLLLVQVCGLAHLTLETHALGSDGALHDVAQLLEDAHDANEPHLCAPERDTHVATPSAGCAVVASWRAAVESQPSPVTLHPTTQHALPVAPTARPAPPQDVLSRAPKSSPPVS